MRKLAAANLVLLIFCFFPPNALAQGRNHKVLKCLVCRKIFEEVMIDINKPEVKKKTIAVGGYHLDDEGNTNQRVVPYYQSDVFLTEVLDGVCDKMKDYVRARRKSDNKLIILPLVLPGGAMNPEFSEVNPILDDDLNKSLGHYCQEISNEYDEEIIASLKRTFSGNDEESNFCSTVAPYCDGTEEFEDSEEPSPDLNDVIGGLNDEL